MTAEDPVTVVRRLKAESSGTGIWLCGGGKLASTLLDEIDRLVLKLQPVLFGTGIPLFAERPYAARKFDLVSSTPFRSHVMINEYRARRKSLVAERGPADGLDVAAAATQRSR